MLKCVRRAAVAASLCLCAAAGLTTRADEVLFKNGDKLTGTIVEMGADKLKIKSAVAGDVTVDLKDVDTFSTTGPVELHLKDGTVVNRPVAAAPGGNIQPEAGGAVAAGPVAIADVASINPGYGKWKGSLTLAALVTRGNTDTDSISFGADAARRGEDDRLSFAAGYFFGRQKDQDTGDKNTTVDNWFAQGKYDYFFTKKFYAYGLTRIERDRIADLDLRLSPSVGVGYQWHEGPDWNFATEAGLGWVYEEYSTGESDDHFAARFAYHYDRKLNDKLTLTHNVEYLPSIEDTSDFNLNADLGLRATISGNMFADFKAEWRYDATPAPEARKQDLRYILGVGWTF